MLLVNSFSVLTVPVTVLSSIIDSCVELISEISQYFDIIKEYDEKLGNPALDKDIGIGFFTTFSKQISWFLGKTAA